MTEPLAEGEPTMVRKVVSGIIVVILVIAVWWFIEWRTAPPPPPNIPLPEPTPEEVAGGPPVPTAPGN